MESSSSLPALPWGPTPFAPTRWSLVRRSTATEPRTAREAAEVFCRVYWAPLYQCLRGKGYSHIDSQDHVQSFLARLVQRGTLGKADPQQGKLRFYLRTLVLRHASSRDRATKAGKRGGGMVHVSMDGHDVESASLPDGAPLSEPEAAFRRCLATRLVEESVAVLEREFARAGRQALFEALLPGLEGGLEDSSFSKLAETTGMSQGSLRVAAFRLRERFRKHLRLTAAAALGIPVGPELDRELRLIFG